MGERTRNHGVRQLWFELTLRWLRKIRHPTAEDRFDMAVLEQGTEQELSTDKH
jgi:hypothetical protein